MKKTTRKQINQLPSSSSTNLLLASVFLSMEEIEKTMSALKNHPERVCEISDMLYKQLLVKRELTTIDELKGILKSRIADWSLKYGAPTIPQYAYLGKVYGIAITELLENIRPNDLYDLLSCYVVGQDDYKRKLAVAFNLYLMKHKAGSQNMDLPKSSLLVSGPSGSGKTYAVQTLSKIFGKPVIRINCNSLVPVGIVGTTIPDHYTSLRVKGMSPEKIEESLVLLDEFDKIMQNPEYSEALQNEVLSLIDDRGEIRFRENFGYNSDQITISTKNMMFVLTGVFDGIDKVKKRNGLGFVNRNESTNPCHLGAEDLLAYGLKPEIVGRIQNYSMVESLTVSDMLNVLNAPLESPMLYYQNYFRLQGVELIVTDEAKQYLAELAFNRKLGVRGLRGLLHELLMDEMFSWTSCQVEITCDYINKHINQ